MAVLLTPPYLQFFDDDGLPLNGGKVYTYTATGTFSVGKATYTTEAGSVEHPNPIILDAAGRPTTGNGSIWIVGTYDFKVTDSLDNIIETTQSVTAFTALPSTSDAYFESFSGTGAQTAFTTSEDLGTDEKAIYVWVDNGLQENVTNGTFATDTGWTKGAGWTIGAGVATAAGAISTALSQTAGITIVASEAYVLTYTVTRSAGDIIPSIGGTAGVTRSVSGTYTEVISAGTTQTLAFTGAGFTGTLDSISITVANPKGYNIQNPANYTIDGTTLTFTTAPAIGTGNIYVSAPSLLVGAASSSAADAAASAASALEAEAGAVASNTALNYLFDTSTTIADPGTGDVRFDNATLSLVTEIAISALTADSGNPDVSDFIFTWDDSTNSPKGTIMVRKSSAPATYVVFNIDGGITDSTTWLTIPVTYVSSNGTLSASDSLYFGFSRAGNAGAGGDVYSNTASSVIDEIALFADTSGKLIKRATTTGILKGTSGVVSAATAGTDYYAPGSTDVAVADGGTGLSTLTANNLLVGAGASSPTFIAPGTADNILSSNGTVFASVTMASLMAETLSTIGSKRFGPAGSLIVKWGYTVDANASGTVTFAVAFPSTCYTVIACSVGAAARYLSPGTVGASSFTWINSGAGQTGLSWVAFGV